VNSRIHGLTDRAFVFAAFLAIGGALACSNPAQDVCTPGRVSPCECASGVGGSSTCGADGRPRPCQCGPGVDSGPGDDIVEADAVGSDVGSADTAGMDAELGDSVSIDADSGTPARDATDVVDARTCLAAYASSLDCTLARTSAACCSGRCRPHRVVSGAVEPLCEPVAGAGANLDAYCVSTCRGVVVSVRGARPYSVVYCGGMWEDDFFSLTFGHGCATDRDCCVGQCLSGSCVCSPLGTTCVESADCCSTHCDEGRCVAAEPSGGRAGYLGCTRGLECSSGRCFAGVCAPGRTTGRACVSGADCYSGICTSGLCAGALAGTGGCSQDSDCATGLVCDPYDATCRACIAAGSSTPTAAMCCTHHARLIREPAPIRNALEFQRRNRQGVIWIGRSSSCG